MTTTATTGADAPNVGDTRYLGNHSSIPGATAFKNSAGTDTDPTGVTLRVKKPDGTTTVYTYQGSPGLFREATGRYYASITFDQGGVWTWKLAGTGAVAEAAQGFFYVQEDLA